VPPLAEAKDEGIGHIVGRLRGGRDVAGDLLLRAPLLHSLVAHLPLLLWKVVLKWGNEF